MSAWSRNALFVKLGVAGVLAASIGLMLWLGLGGGVNWGENSARQVEECGVKASAATSMSRTLAPALLAAFLEQGGYSVALPESFDSETIDIVGRRGDFRCTITLRRSTSTEALKDLASGEASLAFSLRPINDRDIAAFSAAGAGDLEAGRAQAEHVIALDALAVAVAADNPMRSLTADQFREVMLGGTRNWSEVGGPDQPIHVHAPVDGMTAADYPNDIITVRNALFDSLFERARMHATEWDMTAALREDPLGIGPLSSAFATGDSGVRALAFGAGSAPAVPTAESVANKTYPLVRRLFLYVRPSDMLEGPLVPRFVSFAQSPGARPAIEAAGFFAPPEPSGADQPELACLRNSAESLAVEAAVRGARRIGRPLNFEPGSTQLSVQSLKQIEELAEPVRAQINEGGALIVVGHADAHGSTDNNRQMGLQRAIAARSAFERLSVFGAIVESGGEMCGLEASITEEGRRANQRVELWLRPGAVRTRMRQ
jgi:phosphate transport system substrate-binding protein